MIMDYYTKDQALGYLIMAAKKMGLSINEVKKLVYGAEDEMEEWTKEWAEQTYDEFKGNK